MSTPKTLKESQEPKGSQGLYQIISSKIGRRELTSKDIVDFLSKNLFDPETKKRFLDWSEELKFWEEYALIYRNLEKARPYSGLTKVLEKLIEPKAGEIWLDVGCGPAKMSQLVWKKSRGAIQKIIGMDVVLSPGRETLARLGNSIPLELVYANIGEELPFPDNHFDGIIANLILPYVTDFKGKTGVEAFEATLREMYRVLRPNGHMVWSTPKKNVHFQWVFLASMPDMLNVYEYIAHRDITRILQGTRILKHALEIQKKGKEGTYTFLDVSELEQILAKIGFISPIWQKAFTNQALVNRVYKPALPNP